MGSYPYSLGFKVVLAIYSYFAIGGFFARLRIWVYQKYIRRTEDFRHWTAWIIFPLTAFRNNAAKLDDDIINPPKDPGDYVSRLAFSWPLFFLGGAFVYCVIWPLWLAGWLLSVPFRFPKPKTN